MSKMIDRVAYAIWQDDLSKGHCDEGTQVGSYRSSARAAIEAMREFSTEDFTLTEAAGIRRLIDEALDKANA